MLSCVFCHPFVCFFFPVGVIFCRLVRGFDHPLVCLSLGGGGVPVIDEAFFVHAAVFFLTTNDGKVGVRKM